MKTLLPVLALILSSVGAALADCPVGDLDGDCQVDLEDLQVFASQWLQPPGSPADLNGDDDVGVVDLALLAENWREIRTALVISEFMAVNGSKLPLGRGELLDEDGDSADWIEIYNSTSAVVSLDGWYLTDSTDNLRKWEFPPVQVNPGQFKTVFASSKDRDDPDGELHTNFKLTGSAAFLALVKPDGRTIAHAHEYPQQFGDISYGLAGADGTTSITHVLVPEYTDAKALIPQDDSLGLSWTDVDFNDSGWLQGTTGVGYDYGGLIGLDVAAMRNNNETVYVRIRFDVTDLASLEDIRLWMKYDDGFAAYINGHLVESENAPGPDDLAWNSGATALHDDGDAVNFVDFRLPSHCINYFRLGANVLAIHGLNRSLTSSDLLILPKLIVNKTGTVDFSMVTEGYFFDPTPGQANGPIIPNLGPAIRNVTKDPPQPSEDEDLIITAEVKETSHPISEVKLHCRINFQEGNRWLPGSGLPMLDDGNEVDAVANDGIYTAAVPSMIYSAGNMIRWHVTAKDTEGIESREPPFLLPANSPEYFGTVVEDPYIHTELPLIQWFVENVSASESDSGTRGCVYYLGEFYDNIVIHRRGGSTAGMPKKHYKFRFNRGRKFNFDPRFARVNEFNLNSTHSDKAYLRQNLAFEAYDWCGCPSSVSFPMRAERNGEFYGVQIFIEEPEEELLEREGLDPDGALYKMYNTFYAGGSAEKKSRRWEGRSDLDNFCNSINNTSGTTRHNNIFDQVNLPLTLDYLVGTIITHQNDHPHKNHYLYRDSSGSGEWCFLPWDHDLTWGSNWTGSSFHDYIYADDDQVPGKPTDVKPSHPFIGKQDCKEWNYHWNGLINALLNDATVRQMYLRRLRTVMDELLKAPGTPYSELVIENHIDELVAQMAPDVIRDYLKWANPWSWGGQGGYPRDQSFEYAINIIKNDYLAVRRTHLFVTHNIDKVGSYNIAGSYSAAIPDAQPANATIGFGNYDYNPASGNQDEEYIELINPNSYAVDISGWKLTGGVQHEFLPGTVIVAGGNLYVSPNVAAFRSRATSPTGGQGRFAQGNYRGHLSSWGETINLLDEYEALVDTITYPGNPSDQQRYLRITEIMYHPADPCEDSAYNAEAFEYIELRNIGATTLSLNGVKFTEGIYYTFGSISLPAGDYLVLMNNQAAFESRYTLPGGVQIPGPYQGQLSNDGEEVKLEDSTNSTILEFDYKDGWYGITDGMGFSLTVKGPVNTEPNAWDDKSTWRPSANIGGSPGWDDTNEVPVLGSVKINELLAHSHADASDWIELHNTTGERIHIGGWFLSDNSDDLMKYEIADGTWIDPCDYIVFYQNKHFGNIADSGCHSSFALSENGETLYLHSGRDGVLTGYSEEERFGASETGVAFGRYKKSTGTYNFVAMSENTSGSANAYPMVGPVVINEIMYHPQNDGDAEYVELLNISGGPIDLEEWDNEQERFVPWRFTDEGGISFDFLLGTTVAAGEYILLVRNLSAFESEFGAVGGGVQVFEWELGKLDNGSEKLQLSKPGDEVEGTRYYIRVDRVNYSDGSHPVGDDPWPTEADGAGSSLSRKVPTDYGNDVINWKAASASPGVVNP